MTIDIETLLELPAADRFRLAEVLWSSIPDDAGSEIVPLRPEDQREIDLALADCETRADDSIAFEDLMAELRRKLSAP